MAKHFRGFWPHNGVDDMRIATHIPDDSGTWCRVNAIPYLRIYLDEKLVRRVFAVDDVAGEVWVGRLDASGQQIVNREKSEFVMEKLAGKVEIRVADLTA